MGEVDKEIQPRFDYMATIAGGCGPDVWDTEMTCSAKSMREAAEYFCHWAEERDADVLSIEQMDY